MEAKPIRLKKEIGLFKAKKQKLGQYRSKDMSAMKENQAQLTRGKWKSQENLAETIEEEEVYPTQSPKNKDATPTPSPQMSQTKNTQKRDYASVAASKHPWTRVVYKNRKVNPYQTTKPSAKIEHQRRRILFPRVSFFLAYQANRCLRQI